MVRCHAITPLQRAQCARQMIANAGQYGAVTALSRTMQVSRPTLYQWKAKGEVALAEAFREPAALAADRSLERAVLTLWAEGHASVRGIQRCLEGLGYGWVSLGSIAAVLREAQQRALRWQQQAVAPAGERTLALDELFGNDRQGAYLSVVDTESWAVWSLAGPVAVDQESWTLVLWGLQERGVRWRQTVSDGGAAMALACAAVDPQGQHSRDVWHVLHAWSAVQGRLDRLVGRLAEQTATAQQRAQRRALGERLRGRVSDPALTAAALAPARYLAEGVRYLSGELRSLLEVVVLDGRGLLRGVAERRQEMETLLALLSELAATAPAPHQRDLVHLERGVRLALPGVLLFAEGLAAVEDRVRAALGERGLGLLGWAWQRRQVLGPGAEDLLALLPFWWRPVAAAALGAWSATVRASSAVENWNSILRPHLAVHRTLTQGYLALLAVWHNHRMFARGERAGRSPLHLSGLTDAPTDWLVALGYAPANGPVQADSTANPLALSRGA